MSKENIKIDYDLELDKLSICYEDGTKVVIRMLQEEAIPKFIDESICNCYDEKVYAQYMEQPKVLMMNKIGKVC